MLVIVFYRVAVPINQEVAAISIGFDKEIEDALLEIWYLVFRHPYSCVRVCVCVYVDVTYMCRATRILFNVIYDTYLPSCHFAAA
jgi:hypothetical protein